MTKHGPFGSDRDPSWHEEADVVVIGYGYAGAIAALEAHDAGAEVLLIEKMPDSGGISITSGGNVRFVENADEGFRHLQASNAGTTPDSVLRALAAGMSEIPAYFEKLCRASGATLDRRQADGNYPFPGTATFGYVSVKHVPDFDAERSYPFVSSYVPIHRAAGVRLFKVIEDNIRLRHIRVMLSTPARRLVVGNGEIPRSHGRIRRQDHRHQGAPSGRSRLRRVRSERGDATAVLAGKARSQRSLHGQYRRRHPDGAGSRCRALAYVALPRRVRL